MEKYIQSIKMLIIEVKDDQKKELTTNKSPIEIANRIKNKEAVISLMEDLVIELNQYKS